MWSSGVFCFSLAASGKSWIEAGFPIVWLRLARTLTQHAIALPGDGLGSLKPGIGELKVISSSKHWIEVEALVNITNPTPYTGYIPFVNVHLYKNDSMVGEATAENVTLGLGENSNLRVRGKWNPLGMGGAAAEQIGLELISQYISGYNVTMVAKSHRGSIPRLPIIGDSLSRPPAPARGSRPSVNRPSISSAPRWTSFRFRRATTLSG
jgi:hypothetical protein